MGAIDRGLLRAFEKATESKVGVFSNLKHPKPGSRHIFLASNGKQSWRVFELEAAEISVKKHLFGKQRKAKLAFFQTRSIRNLGQDTSFWQATENKLSVS